MLPSIESLRCFAAAARTLNFRSAARTVALTPAAFGQRIRQLEEQLGGALFARTTRRVELTPHGLALVPLADKCLLAAAECARVVSSKDAGPSMDVVLGTRHELGLSWILPELDRLTEDQPFVTVHLYFGSGPDLLLRVRTLEIDCAIASTRVDDPKLATAALHKESYVLVGAPALLARRPLRAPADAAQHVLADVNPQRSLFRYFSESKGAPELAFPKTLTLGTIEAIRRRVLDARAVAVLPEYLVAPDLARKRLVRLFPKVRLLDDAFRLVFRADDVRRPVFERFAAVLRERPLR